MAQPEHHETIIDLGADTQRGAVVAAGGCGDELVAPKGDATVPLAVSAEDREQSCPRESKGTDQAWETTMWDWIRPFERWRTGMPGFGGEEEETALLQKVREEGPASVDELKRVIDNSKDSELRSTAMRLMVTLHNSKLLEADVVTSVLGKVVASTAGKSYDTGRQDALFALASLAGTVGLAKLTDLLGDARSDEYLRKDALLALAYRKDPTTLEHLAAGILELPEQHDRRRLAEGLQKMWDVPWEQKAKAFIRLLGESSKQRTDVDAAAVLDALKSDREEWTRHSQKLADYFIKGAVDQNERMSGILAELLLESEGRDPIHAGNTINQYQRNHGLPDTALHELRIQVGGAPALSGIIGLLHKNLEEHFQRPIHELNKSTSTMWQKTLEDAHRGFLVRITMSVVVFALGVILVALSSYKILFGDPGKEVGEVVYGTAMPFVAGLGIMLLITYTGPLKEIRQSVTDLATASAAFIAYVHRVLETSHTFSYYYLKETISFEEMKKSSDLIRDALSSTVEALNRKGIDSSEDTIKTALEMLRQQTVNKRKRPQAADHAPEQDGGDAPQRLQRPKQAEGAPEVPALELPGNGRAASAVDAESRL